MRIAFGCDHRGVLLRDRVLQELAALGHEAVEIAAATTVVSAYIAARTPHW